jgi:hypothetical protein
MKTNHFRILAVDDERLVLDLYHEVLCPSSQEVESLRSSGDVQPASSNQDPVSPSFNLTLCEHAEEAADLASGAQPALSFSLPDGCRVLRCEGISGEWFCTLDYARKRGLFVSSWEPYSRFSSPGKRAERRDNGS